MKKLLEILAILVIIGFGVAYVQKNNPENVTPPTESSGAVVSETTTVDTASLPQNAKLINTDGILSFKQRCVLGAIDGGPLSYQLIITLMDTTRSTFNSIHFDINSKTQDELLNV